MSQARPSRRIALIALTAVLALVLTSCFNGDEDTADTTTTTAQAAPPPTPTVAPPPPETVPPTTQAPPTTTEVVVFEPPPPTEAPPPPPEPPADPQVDDGGILLYTVQAGDTLFSIAQRFGVNLDDVIEANNISDADVIYEGDTLTIPPAG